MLPNALGVLGMGFQTWTWPPGKASLPSLSSPPTSVSSLLSAHHPPCHPAPYFWPLSLTAIACSSLLSFHQVPPLWTWEATQVCSQDSAATQHPLSMSCSLASSLASWQPISAEQPLEPGLSMHLVSTTLQW